MTSILNAPFFHDESAAYEYVETHLWLNGPVCPHCGNAESSKIGRLTGKTTRSRDGNYAKPTPRCQDCCRLFCESLRGRKGVNHDAVCSGT